MNKTITLIAFLISFCSFSQTYQTLNKVKIEKGKDLKFKKKVTVKDCDLIVPAGSVIKRKQFINLPTVKAKLPIRLSLKPSIQPKQ